MKFPNLGFSTKNDGQAQGYEQTASFNLPSGINSNVGKIVEIPLRTRIDNKLPRVWLDDEGTYHVDIPCGSRCVVNIESK
jgi:hypothetical protein